MVEAGNAGGPGGAKGGCENEGAGGWSENGRKYIYMHAQVYTYESDLVPVI